MWDNRVYYVSFVIPLFTQNGKTKVVTSRVAKTRNGGTMSESALGFIRCLRQSLDFGLYSPNKTIS
jgi:hypothetical protein